MEKVTKIDLVESIYTEDGFEKQDIQKISGFFMDFIKKSLGEGKIVELRGFGTFEPRLRKGRKKARNPRTGESVSSQPHYVAVFRAGRELKNALLKLEPLDAEK